ncbi:squalene synthase HpnD [Pseudoroseomonas wenyumeiae]|uniref:Squalene synthase HpnD n=1 Tax=Teichococcus wenyumeiae TaxID=2478470 RepID=A0A3A9JP84_9PROT|nr:presqualene diphosphate synthase HpnD [Pseudoroseomonas wenyumeiae]RKK02448.1 squalene synthase HpnD [Pseudoroseomonas wenyumeiae]RMI25292.1 squalene synthase HpnD [Pseudoroseomonas wenyumeiae]
MTTDTLLAPQAVNLQAQVSGSSFYTAMRLMPRAEREAMFAIYAFCRLVDDIADDGTRPRPIRAQELERWRADLAALYAGQPAGRAAFLAGPVRDFGLRHADFLAVIDGMEMDVAADIQAPGLATLDLYCDRVASAVGRLSVRVFGMEEAPGLALAHELGRALQLTNILRDLDEDAGIGRLYLPREVLDAAGIAGDDPLAVVADPRVDAACRALAPRALAHFAAADQLLASRPRGRLLAPRLMAAVYRVILEKMLAQGWTAPRRRARVGKARLLWLVARCGLAR